MCIEDKKCDIDKDEMMELVNTGYGKERLGRSLTKGLNHGENHSEESIGQILVPR